VCLLKVASRLPSCLEKAPFCFSKIIWTFLELYSMVGNEIVRGNRIGESRGQISGFEEIEKE